MHKRLNILFAASLAIFLSAGFSSLGAQNPQSRPSLKTSLPATPPELALVPWPKSLTKGSGQLVLTQKSRIMAADRSLASLAAILSDEIGQVGSLHLALGNGPGRAGDIALSLDPSLKGEEYVLEVKDTAFVRGGNYGAVALGTVTLLQALRCADGKVLLPRLHVEDSPATDYRGLMIDVARSYHPVENLKQIVELCRLYKTRYLQLHLTDDQSFMFPSKAYPQLATQNQNGGKTYTLEELKDLVAFADARNVTIVPEYEVPGHSAAANRALPDLFLIKGTKPYEHHASINFAKEEVMQAIATIVGEMCDVFRSSPYFHIGGDEADLEFAHQNADFQAAFKKHNLPNQHQLYRKLVADMDAIVKRQGKQMIVWEGFTREPNAPVQIPKDVIVMAYEIVFYQPDKLLEDGYRVINGSWTPLYVVGSGRPPAEIYAWQKEQFKPFGAPAADRGVVVPPSSLLLGAQMCAWEQAEAIEIPNERLRLPAMMERIWNPAARRSYADFERRLGACDALLDLLVHRLRVQVDGLAGPGANDFDAAVTVTLTPAPGTQGAIRYTLDGRDPTINATAYSAPIAIRSDVDFRALVFGADGQALGYPFRARYAFRPVTGEAAHLLPGDKFTNPITLTLRTGEKGEIRYTLDGKDPTTNAAAYTGPIRIADTNTTVKAALFINGQKQGGNWEKTFKHVDY